MFTTPGGTVAAECGSAGAYLEYWSPQQGYAVARVVRGPTLVASVTFYGQQGESGDDGLGAIRVVEETARRLLRPDGLVAV